MPIETSALNRDFIVVDERTTVRQVRDQVAATGKDFVYIVVRLASGQYAVLWLGDLILALQKYSETVLPEMMDAALGDMSDLLAPRAADAVEQADMETGEAKGLVSKPGKMLVVLADGEVLGLMGRWRGTLTGVDLDWLSQPPPGVLTVEELLVKPPPRRGPPRSPEVKPERRWIKAEIAKYCLSMVFDRPGESVIFVEGEGDWDPRKDPTYGDGLGSLGYTPPDGWVTDTETLDERRVMLTSE